MPINPEGCYGLMIRECPAGPPGSAQTNNGDYQVEMHNQAMREQQTLQGSKGSVSELPPRNSLDTPQQS